MLGDQEKSVARFFMVKKGKDFLLRLYLEISPAKVVATDRFAIILTCRKNLLIV